MQGTGHADFFQKDDGSWWTVFLAYRRYGGDFHHLGRETFLAPVTWEKGWPVINGGKPVDANPGPAVSKAYSFEETGFGPEWMHILHPVEGNYLVKDGRLILRGNGCGLETQDKSPTAVLRRQERAVCTMETELELLEDGEAGLCLYQIFCGHAGIYLRRNGGSMSATVRYRIRNLEHRGGGRIYGNNYRAALHRWVGGIRIFQVRRVLNEFLLGIERPEVVQRHSLYRRID